MSLTADGTANTLPEACGGAPLVAPGRGWTAAVLLVAGNATLATSFAALPVPLLAFLIGIWSAAVVLFAQSNRGPLGFLVLSICVKTATLFIIGLLIFDPTSSIGARNGLYWIPLGLLNMGSGLWFLRVIRRRAS
jgi:hypothetical protein